MDSTELFVTIGGALLIACTLWFFFGRREESTRASSVAAEKAPYACPMHPWITSRDPMATCSICGMKLTARDAGSM